MTETCLNSIVLTVKSFCRLVDLLVLSWISTKSLLSPACCTHYFKPLYITACRCNLWCWHAWKCRHLDNLLNYLCSTTGHYVYVELSHLYHSQTGNDPPFERHYRRHYVRQIQSGRPFCYVPGHGSCQLFYAVKLALLGDTIEGTSRIFLNKSGGWSIKCSYITDSLWTFILSFCLIFTTMDKLRNLSNLRRLSWNPTSLIFSMQVGIGSFCLSQ
jgi:hypothetical protein